MSADLFAEFEEFSKPSPQQSQPPKPFTRPLSLTSEPFAFGNNVPTRSTTQLGHQKSQSQRWGNFPQSDSWNSLVQPVSQPTQSQSRNEDDDDDGWGDFEVAPNASQSPAPSQPPVTKPTSAENPALRRTRVVRAPTIDLITNHLIDLPGPSTLSKEAKPPPKPVSQKIPKKPIKSDPNVLFDADDFDGEQEDDDDFGEFETVASPIQSVPDFGLGSSHAPPVAAGKKDSQLLLGLDLNESAPSYPRAPRSPSFRDRNPFPGLAVATPIETVKKMNQKPKSSPVTAWPTLDRQDSIASDDFGNDWDAFDELPESAKSNPKTAASNWYWDSGEPAQQKTLSPLPVKTTSKSPDSSWAWDPIDAKTETQVDSPKNDLPPINVPPPSILLSVFPQLIDQANTSLYKPVSGQPFTIKNRILSDPKTVEFLKGYLALATVAARIIAGRKSRWHRDKFLTQGMSISAAGSKGMKLAGVDKAQTAREDRETTDVVSTWKEHVGRLRSAVAAANSSIKNTAEQLRIPEISDTMQVQTAKMVPTAPKACVICGLKRNERVTKVDYEVEDSFGEWWVDHWGHMACKRFWLQHENALRQR